MKMLPNLLALKERKVAKPQTESSDRFRLTRTTNFILSLNDILRFFVPAILSTSMTKSLLHANYLLTVHPFYQNIEDVLLIS